MLNKIMLSDWCRKLLHDMQFGNMASFILCKKKTVETAYRTIQCCRKWECRKSNTSSSTDCDCFWERTCVCPLSYMKGMMWKLYS